MTPEHTSESVRLNKFIALHKGISRREADLFIEKGLITVNGNRAVLGAQVTSTDEVALKGRVIAAETNYRYVLFYKPAGYVCSRKKQGDAETIYTILPTQIHTLKPVGRLDKDSSGLLLLTNDGDFAHRMTHPSFHKQKTYEVTLDHDLSPLHQQMISDFGIQLEDGESKLLLERQSNTDRKAWKVMMHEGRNRQIRRTFAALGYSVTRLHRTTFGPYSLGDISAGEYEDTIIR